MLFKTSVNLCLVLNEFTAELPMKMYIILWGLFLSHFANANCYLPLKYGKLDVTKQFTIDGNEPEKLQSFIQKLDQNPGAITLLIKKSGQIFKSASYKPSNLKSISIYPPTIATGERYIFYTNRYYIKILGRDKFGNSTSETGRKFFLS